MRIMGIDYGDSRIGIAVSDPMGWTAQGIETVNNKGSQANVISKILELARQYEVKKIVVGFPKNMNGTIGPRGEKTLEFINALDKKLNACDGTGDKYSVIDIIKWDERLTTVMANRTMHEMGVKTSKKKGLVDRIAAVYILQNYLDSIKA